MFDQTLLKFAPYLASLFCFAAGIAILAPVVVDRKTDALSISLGLYFIGKSFFVGPALYSILRRTSAKEP